MVGHGAPGVRCSGCVGDTCHFGTTSALNGCVVCVSHCHLCQSVPLLIVGYVTTLFDVLTSGTARTRAHAHNGTLST